VRQRASLCGKTFRLVLSYSRRPWNRADAPDRSAASPTRQAVCRALLSVPDSFGVAPRFSDCVLVNRTIVRVAKGYAIGTGICERAVSAPYSVTIYSCRTLSIKIHGDDRAPARRFLGRIREDQGCATIVEVREVGTFAIGAANEGL
jgi:hypothetical protein